MPKKSPKTTKAVAKKTVASKPAVKKTTKTKTVAVKKAAKSKASEKKVVKMKTVAVKTSKKKYDEVKSLKLWLFLVGFLLLLGLVLSNLYWSQDDCNNSCKNTSPAKVLSKKVIDEPVLNLANPASLNCLDMNGNLEMKKRGDGGEYGVCIFPNGNECEEWTLMREECPADGVVAPTEGYRTVLEYYCAVTGGSIDKENRECVLSEELTCDLEDYYNGLCHK